MRFNHIAIGLKALFPSPVYGRCLWRHKCSKVQSKKKESCWMKPIIRPKFYQQLRPCKTDAELRAQPKLGSPRCDVPYNPLCMGPCFNQPRLDEQMYKPSKSLDRAFQVNWVDCELEPKRPKRCVCQTVPPEITRRGGRTPYCPRSGKLRGCKMLKPLDCTPLVPSPPTSETRCIKFPLCECKPARLKTRCRFYPKPQPNCRIRTQYPSYSECQSVPNPAPIDECTRKVSICESWRRFRSRHGPKVPQCNDVLFD